MKKNFLPVRPQPRETAISRPAVDVINLISSLSKSGRRGERSQIQILSPRGQSLLTRTMKFSELVAVLAIACAPSVGAQSPSPVNSGSPAPAPAAETASAEASPSPSPTVSVEPPSLIPPNILPGPGAGALP